MSDDLTPPADAMDSNGLSDRRPGEQTEPSADSSEGLSSRLLSTEGGQPITEIQSEYGVSKPVALLCRGTMKIAQKSGFPAIADLFAGTWLFVLANTGEETAEETSSETPEEPQGLTGADSPEEI